ncbi:PadR family transcriptional regulator [Acidobacteriota bacterium]
MENKIKQLRKGILELAILGSLHHNSHYGYSLIKSISGDSDIELSEGTIYPILARLSKEQLIRSEWVESKQGPPRKYYSLTLDGENAYKILSAEFEKLADMVANTSRKPLSLNKKEARTSIHVKKEKDDAE